MLAVGQGNRRLAASAASEAMSVTCALASAIEMLSKASMPIRASMIAMRANQPTTTAPLSVVGPP